MNETVVVAAIGVVVAVFILRPLLRGHGASVPLAAPRESLTVAQPASSISSEELAELELDRAMGRVSEEDFLKWRGELEAGEAVDERDALPASEPKPANATARAEALVRKWSEAPRSTCPTCGLRPEPEARYCSNCGASLTT